MIGIILTGHGRFAEGLGSSLEMIAGKSPAFETVNFLETESTEQLEHNLKNAWDKLKAECDGVIICCDLLGGSPFKSAATLSISVENTSVLAGVNLPSLLEMLFARLDETSADALAESIIGKDTNRLIKFTMPTVKESVEAEDGI